MSYVKAGLRQLASLPVVVCLWSVLGLVVVRLRDLLGQGPPLGIAEAGREREDPKRILGCFYICQVIV